MHNEQHAQSNKAVEVRLVDGSVIEAFRIEDWWDRLTGTSWMFSDGNPAAMIYAMRSAGGLPLDDEVVYGKDIMSGLGHLVHVSEIGEVVS